MGMRGPGITKPEKSPGSTLYEGMNFTESFLSVSPFPGLENGDANMTQSHPICSYNDQI